MKLDEALLALTALAQPSRLEVFRLLVRSRVELCAGEIAEKLALPKSTLSFHLKELSHAGLIEARREGRSINYRLRVDGIRGLLGFLSEDCCEGRPELCLPSSGCCAMVSAEQS